MCSLQTYIEKQCTRPLRYRDMCSASRRVFTSSLKKNTKKKFRIYPFRFQTKKTAFKKEM